MRYQGRWDTQDVDGRNKSGHDERNTRATNHRVTTDISPCALRVGFTVIRTS
jgi:hypothetical protein